MDGGKEMQEEELMSGSSPDEIREVEEPPESH